MPHDITVVIPTYNRSDRLPGLVATLEAQTLDPARFEVLIVDNGSIDDTSEVLAKLAATSRITIRPLRIEVNDGPAKARNLGWREAGTEILAYTDDDVLCDPTWLETGLAAMQADARLGVMQGETTAPADTVFDDLPEWTLWRVITEPSPYFEGCNIFFRRTALEEIGGFDEEIGWWGEDTTTGWQIIEAGWGRGFCAESRVVHPLEFRGPMYFVRNGYREKNVVMLAARHPGLRAEAFWRPWAFRKRDAAFAVAVASVVVGLRWRPALLGVVPYLRWGAPRKGVPDRPKAWAEIIAVDAARAAGHLAGSWQSRDLML